MDALQRLVRRPPAGDRGIDRVADHLACRDAERAERPLLEGDGARGTHRPEEVGAEMAVELGAVEDRERRGLDRL